MLDYAIQKNEQLTERYQAILIRRMTRDSVLDSELLAKSSGLLVYLV